MPVTGLLYLYLLLLFAFIHSLIYSFIRSFIHPTVWIATGPYSLPKRVFQRVSAHAACVKFHRLLASLRLFSSCLRLLPRLPVSSIFPSITFFRRQFLCKMWTNHLAFFFFYSTLISSLTLSNNSSFLHDRFNWSSPSFSRTIQRQLFPYSIQFKPLKKGLKGEFAGKRSKKNTHQRKNMH